MHIAFMTSKVLTLLQEAELIEREKKVAAREQELALREKALADKEKDKENDSSSHNTLPSHPPHSTITSKPPVRLSIRRSSDDVLKVLS